MPFELVFIKRPDRYLFKFFFVDYKYSKTFLLKKINMTYRPFIHLKRFFHGFECNFGAFTFQIGRFT